MEIVIIVIGSIFIPIIVVSMLAYIHFKVKREINKPPQIVFEKSEEEQELISTLEEIIELKNEHIKKLQ
jgi:hypothetical protein